MPSNRKKRSCEDEENENGDKKMPAVEVTKLSDTGECVRREWIGV